jgi:hypothetical protein
MSREIHNCDAFEWMAQYGLGIHLEGKENREEDVALMFPGEVFTSIPDISELPGRFGTKCRQNSQYDDYKEWFMNTVQQMLCRTKKCIVFLQSNVRCCQPSTALAASAAVTSGGVGGDNGNMIITEYLDKSYLLSHACQQNGFVLLWHKICYNVDKLDNKPILQRPNWSHLMCFGRKTENIQYVSTLWGTPDVFPRGEMMWSRAIGINAALIGISFLKYVCHSTCVVDPFCGQGTVLAVANACGMNAIGVELSNKRCKKARKLDLLPTLLSLGYRHCRAYGLKDGLGNAEDWRSDQRAEDEEVKDVSALKVDHYDEEEEDQTKSELQSGPGGFAHPSQETESALRSSDH